ncbi:MAG: OB-fold domain-containing protein [Hyphomonadaceae bacterium]|nr:OB-fold domain-containing protein [Hyphomonadaceae bacterium]
MTSGLRPSPVVFEPSKFTRPFWDACRRRVLQAASCKTCGHLFLPAGPVCPQCWSADLGAQALSGYGAVAAFTIYRQAYHPDYPVPYVVALIALKEGPRLISNVVGCAPEAVASGMKVIVRFEPRGELVLPLFAPAIAKGPEP